jgi:predicted TIM-barrel fold metal-dependent hydrolase
MDEAAFRSIPKVDAHMHIQCESDAFIRQAAADGFQLITFVAGSERVSDIDADFERGAMAVKIWKDVGMVLRDPTGRFIRADDERFDPLFDHIALADKTLAAHLGEPRMCWIPLEDMPGDGGYYRKHPEYHMYLHPDHPPYEAHLEARDNMLEKHPNLRVVGCHIGSMEHDVSMVAEWFERFPNFAVDLSARISSLKRQDSDKVREWFLAWADRILYGTDLVMRPSDDPQAYAQRVHETWLSDWEYLSTDKEEPSPHKNEEGVIFKGLSLPEEILRKVYSENAKTWYPELP